MDGCQRFITVICEYLMYTYEWSVDSALSYLKSKSVISNNNRNVLRSTLNKYAIFLKFKETKQNNKKFYKKVPGSQDMVISLFSSLTHIPFEDNETFNKSLINIDIYRV